MNLRVMNDEVLTALHMLAQTIDEVNSQVNLCLSALIDGERDHRGYIDNCKINIQLGTRDQTSRARLFLGRLHEQIDGLPDSIGYLEAQTSRSVIKERDQNIEELTEKIQELKGQIDMMGETLSANDALHNRLQATLKIKSSKLENVLEQIKAIKE